MFQKSYEVVGFLVNGVEIICEDCMNKVDIEGISDPIFADTEGINEMLCECCNFYLSD